MLINSLMFHVDVPIRWSSSDMVVVQAELSRTQLATITPLPKRNTTTMEEELKYIADRASQAIGNVKRLAIFHQEFHNSLRTMPEVVNVGTFTPIPFSPEAVRRNQNRGRVYRGRYPEGGMREEGTFYVEVFNNTGTSPEGFDLFGIPFIAGRPFSQMDMDGELALYLETLSLGKTSPNVGKAIINQSLARQLWPGENAGNAVGKIIHDEAARSFEIIGVVPDFLLVSNNKDIVPTLYYSENIGRSSVKTFIVKLHSGLLMNDFRQRLSGLDVGEVTVEMTPLGAIVSESMDNTHMTLQLLGCFALLGIAVAGLSAYTTTSLMVAAMNREIGIRMAMGAQAWDIFLFVLWRGMRAILIALPVGLFLALVLSRILSGFLFQVKVNDPLAWIISCVVLVGITIIAVLIPALRAARVNPLDAMRSE